MTPGQTCPRQHSFDISQKLQTVVTSRWRSAEEPACQYRRYKRLGFDPRVGKTPWGREWQSTPAFLPRESPWTEEPGNLQSMGLQSQTGLKQLGNHSEAGWHRLPSPQLLCRAEREPHSSLLSYCLKNNFS